MSGQILTLYEDCESVDDTVILSVSQKKLQFVEKELLATLQYIDSQLADIDTKGEALDKFNRGLYEVKKMFIEQKLNLLKQISALALHSSKSEEEKGNAGDITDLLSS